MLMVGDGWETWFKISLIQMFNMVLTLSIKNLVYMSGLNFL